MPSRRIKLLMAVLAAVTAVAALAWALGSRVESPAQAAARTQPPSPSPILVPIEMRELSTKIITRGTVRFGLPQPVSVAPSGLKAAAGVITTLPMRNNQVPEGSVLLTASGRPLLVLQGEAPAYRDLTLGTHGQDVLQLEQALARLRFNPGPVDGLYDQQTAAAVARWYRSRGWEPFGPTREQLAALRTLERDAGEANKAAMAAAAALSSSALAIEANQVNGTGTERVAQAELAAKETELRELQASGKADTALALQSERAKAHHANTNAQADLAASIAQEAIVALDPRQTETTRQAAKAKIDLARAHADKTRLEGLASVQTAERAAAQWQGKIQAAQAAVESARLHGQFVRLENEKALRAAHDAQKLAELDARLSQARANQLNAELAQARQRLGTQIPVDELVFIRALPVRVEELKAGVGATASGTLLTVTDNQLSVDSALPLDTAPLVKPGMKVHIDEPSLGVQAAGVVQRIAPTPGTQGVDGFHIYFEVRVAPQPTPLEGYSVRLTIPTQSTHGAVKAVPVSALSLATDGRSRVQAQIDGALRDVTVRPGLVADGFVEITPVQAKLDAGQLVVVGYNEPPANPPSGSAQALNK